MQRKGEQHNDMQIALVDNSEHFLSTMEDSIKNAVTTYSSNRWFYQLATFDSEEIKKLKRFSKLLASSGILTKDDIVELFHLIKRYDASNKGVKQSVVEKIKESFYSYPVLEKLDIDNALMPEQIYMIAMGLAASAVKAMMHLLDKLTLPNEDKIALALSMIGNNALINGAYAEAVISVFTSLQKCNLISREAIEVCILSLNKNNEINESYVKALKEMLRCLGRLEILTLKNVIVSMDTLAQAENELIGHLNPAYVYPRKSKYYEDIDCAIGNLLYFITRHRLNKNSQAYFDAIFIHPTPYFYTNTLSWFIERKLVTENNIDALLTVRDPGALFILEIMAASLTQEDFDAFIRAKDIFSDKDTLAAMRYVNPGLFTKHTQTLLQYCESGNHGVAKRGILEFVAKQNVGYERSAEYRACKESGFQPSGPFIWRPVDDYSILEVERYANQEEIKQAYKKQAMRYHPDKNRDDPSRAQEKFEQVCGAYRRLSALNTAEICDETTSNKCWQHP